MLVVGILFMCVTSVMCNGCPSLCGPNEVIDDCINGGCGRRNCSQLAEPPLCIKVLHCIRGCRCRDGYLRDGNGNCVPLTECPIPNCQKDEIFDFCPGYCQPDCNVDQTLILCQPSPQPGDPDCNPACRCKDNLYRTSEGTCVPKESCPLQCPDDEIYEECPDPCQPNVCSSIWSKFKPCPPLPEDCKPACRCPQGKFRNKIGQCITSEECLKCRGPNEYFSCGGACDNECDKLDIQSQQNCPIVNIQCNRKCYCEDGYARDANNVCIPITECPPQCKENERYVNNVNEMCSAKTCSELGKPLPCFEEGYDNSGPPGCICVDGYVRNCDGVCVPTTECKEPPLFCGPNEVVDGCVNGGCERRNCSQLAEPQLCIDVIHCIRGCRCRDDYLRDENGNCVPLTECPIPQCKEGEIFDFCPGYCQPDCNVDQTLISCQPSPQPGDPDCNPACRCKDHLYRTSEGTCVPKESCPLQCPNDEIYEECPDPCVPNVCSSIWSRYRPCPPSPEDCKPTCRCPDGKYRNKIGQCITSEECLKCHGPNEYFSCGGACDNECDKLDIQSQQNCPIVNIQCNRKCYCEDGYARDANNVCIPINECPPECKENERYVNNVNEMCSAKTCSELGKPLPCFEEGYDNSGPPGCICVDGFVRNCDGACVPTTECPACGGDFNATTGPFNLVKTCDNYDGQHKDTYELAYQSNGCVCRDSYVYNTQTKQCILPQDCPSKCPSDEIYEECPDPCVPNVCSSIWSRYRPCPPSPEDCKPTCRCPDGKYRNKIGQCITSEECLKCRGPNEYFSCGGACDNECDKLDIQSQQNCPIVNIQCNRKCYCEDGYARDANNICIPINECPPECKENERYVNNVNEMCSAKTCSQLGKPLPCFEEGYDNSGPPGCICVDGYVRNFDGVCVPTTECPACGGDFNATSGSGTFCTTCDNYDRQDQVACILSYQLNGCACRDNYVYNTNTKQCILPQDCPSKCPKGEVYVKCPDPCTPNDCSSIGSISKPCAPYFEDCTPACLCPDGKYRNKIGQCITAKQCLKCRGPHEYYSCGGACDNECDKLHKQSKHNCPIVNIQCNKRCYCEDGYARDANKTCVPIHKCPRRKHHNGHF